MPASYLKAEFSRLQSEVQSIYAEMSGKEESLPVRFAPILHYAGADTTNRIVYIHPLLLITPSNIPGNLYIRGLDDPKLKDPTYFKILGKWLSTQFSLNEKNFESLKILFHQHLRFWKDPSMLKRIRSFALAHEVAHIHLGHKQHFWERKVGVATFIAISVLALTTLHSITAATLMAASISYIAQRISSAMRKYFEQQTFEKQADIAAIRVTKDYEGAAAFFEALEKTRVSSRDSKTFWHKTFQVLTAPEELLDLSHPSPKARLQYLQEEVCKS